MPPSRRSLASFVATGLLPLALVAACATTTRTGGRHVPSAAASASTRRPPPVGTASGGTGPSSSSGTTMAAGTTSPTTTPDSTAPPTAAASAGFVGSVAAVTTDQVSSTWRPGCPVGPADLRLLTMGYWGFDGQSHTGTMVVNAAVVPAVLTVFGRLYAERFPIRQMQPEDAYGGQDPVSMAADNTSGFNCRLAVATGPPSWSVHAYGEAIDVNPVENPYLEGGEPQPAQGAPFLDRADVRPGMAEAGGELVAAFASVGWAWGGRWTSSPDYQHFSATGG